MYVNEKQLLNLCYACRDIDIARSQIPKNILQLADEVGVYPGEISPYGSTKAKVSLSILERLKNQKNGKYVIVVG